MCNFDILLQIILLIVGFLNFGILGRLCFTCCTFFGLLLLKSTFLLTTKKKKTIDGVRKMYI